MDRLTEMATFVAVVNERSFTAAAAALDVSAQIVGRRIAQLEERLGAPLIVRTTRNSRLTEAGRRYYDRCRTILDAVDTADRSVAEATTGPPRGALTISAPRTFGGVVVAPIIADFLQFHPLVSVRLRLEGSVTDLIDKRVDAAIRIGALTDSDMRVRSLGEYRLAPYASADYLARRGHPRAPADLADHDCIVFAYEDGGLMDEWEFVPSSPHGGPSEKVRVKGRFITEDGRAMTEMALAGQGLTLQDERVIGLSTAGRLTRVLPDYSVAAKPLNIVYSTPASMSLALRAFIDAVTAALT